MADADRRGLARTRVPALGAAKVSLTHGRMTALVLGVLCAGTASSSALAEWLLKPSADAVRAGESLEVTVFLLNDGARPIREGLPAALPVTAVGPGQAASATLEALDPPAELGEPIPPGAFRKQVYRMQVPLNLRGPSRFALERLPSVQMQITVEAPREQPRVPVVAAPIPLRVDTIPEPALSPHEPMFFLFGTRESTNARFQLSFKYRLFDERGPIGRLLPGMSRLHFGYTQTSLWDIGKSSAPFRDTSYRPSLFYYDPEVVATGGGRYVLGVEAGIEHESNGRDAERSRSLDIAYLRPTWRWFIDDAHYFAVGPRLHAYLRRDENPDIVHYRGHVDLNLRYGKRDGWLFSSTLRKGSGSFGSVQIEASYPIRQPFFANAGGYFHLQYFNGYGETLLDYNVRRSAQFRAGFSIVR